MSFQKHLEQVKAERLDAVDKLNLFVESLPKEEQLALRELLTNHATNVAYAALKEEGYRITRETVMKWKDRYVVQG